MAEQEGVTKQLKAANQMLWVQKMNSIYNQAENMLMWRNMFLWKNLKNTKKLE